MSSATYNKEENVSLRDQVDALEHSLLEKDKEIYRLKNEIRQLEYELYFETRKTKDNE